MADDDSKAIPLPELERLWSGKKVPLRERALWRLLYDSASRAEAVLGLDVPDLDLANRQARARVSPSALFDQAPVAMLSSPLPTTAVATSAAQRPPRHLSDRIVQERSLVTPSRDLWLLRSVTAAGDTDDDRVLGCVHRRVPWAE